MILEIMQQVFYTTAMLVSPILISAALVGVVVSIVQAVTSIQEQTLVFIPKMFTVMLIIFIAFPWMMKTLIFLVNVFFQYMLVVAKQH